MASLPCARNDLEKVLENLPACMTARTNLARQMAPLRRLALLALLLPAAAAATTGEEDRFAIHKGYLSASVQKLVQSYGWTLEWTSEEDRIIDQPFSVSNESLTDGLRNVLNQYKGKFVADLYFGNKVVLVSLLPSGTQIMLPPDDQIGEILPVAIPKPRIEVVRPLPPEEPKKDAEDDTPAAPAQADTPPPPAAPPQWKEVVPDEEDYSDMEVYDVAPEDKSGAEEPHSQLPTEMIPAQVTMPGSMPDAVFQVAALKEKIRAEDIVSHLLSLGYDARLSEYWRNDQSWFRVRVHVDANKDLDKVKRELEGHGYSVWVLLTGFSSRE